MQIAENCVAEINYTLTDDDGEVLDTTDGKTPLAYLHGASNIIPGLENELAGKTAGDNIRVTLPPEKGYGVRNEELRQEMSRDQFDGVDELKVGMMFRADTPQGPLVLNIVEVSDEKVTVDGNHPLAGQTLHFDVTVQDVRDATEEELAHGHAHGAGGHDH